LKQYGSYKDSEISWISDIPSHWDVSRLKFLSNYVKTGSTPPSDNPEYFNKGHIPWYGPGDFNSLVLKDAKRHVTQKAVDENKCRVFDKDSILLIGIGATVGKIGMAKTICSSNQQINAINIDKTQMIASYAMYYLSSIKDIIVSEADSSTLPIFNQTQTKNLKFSHPPIDEQTQIANYLDHKTHQLDNLISKKEKLITLLKEERTAIINQAVTKGIDSNVPMKDSGVEWLGEIPEHWGCKKIGHVSKVIRGASPRPAGDPLLFNGDYLPWITVKEVTNAIGKFIIGTESFLTELGAKQTRILEPETLILSNSGATLGVPRITLIKGGINDGSVAFLNLDVERDYLYYFFVTHTDIYREEAAGYGQPNLNTEIVKSTKTPFPPKREQIDIVSFIENENARFNKVLEVSKKEIEILKEYKTALISEVVTGKVDVRDEIIN